ncbi:MAG TPA: hypothetical protein VG500_01905 [Gemmatimonadales bacterium]|nr:hypothetical protein [Gemmatimonadales bacterium]
MPPENAGYMVAAYVVTAVILGGYAASLWVRARRAVREGAERRDGGTAEGASGRTG